MSLTEEEVKAERDRRLEAANDVRAEVEEDLHYMMTYFRENSMIELSQEQLQIRLTNSVPLLTAMKEAVKTIVKSSEDQREIDAAKELFASFKTDYFDLVANIRENINLKKSRPSVASETATEGNVQNREEREMMAKCPRLPLPDFDGCTENWTKFRDMFNSMVHRTSLSEIVKFQYLMSAMKMPPQQNVLSTYTLSADNYERAWQAVCDRYDDKRKILQHHLTQLFAIKKMGTSSSSELRKLIDTFTMCLNAIEPLGFTISSEPDTANALLVHMITQRLPDDILKEWRKDIKTDFPTYCEIRDFLLAMWRAIDDIQPMPIKPADTKITKITSKSIKTFVANQGKPNKLSCQCCAGDHLLWKCNVFMQMPVSQRYNLVKEKSLCLNCFHSNHQHSECKSKYRCKVCKKSHHSLLHFEQTSSGQQPSDGQQTEVKPFVPYNMVQASSNVTRNTYFSSASFQARHSYRTRHTFLFTVSVLVSAADGAKHCGRALVDTGSDMNFMTAGFASKLKLPLQAACIPVTGINDKIVTVRNTAGAEISSRYGPFSLELGFAILPSITGDLPHRSIPANHVSVPEEYFLADPFFYQSSGCDMLFNIDVFFDILLGQKVKLSSGLKLMQSTLGWMVGGAIGDNVRTPKCAMVSFCGTAAKIRPDIDEKLTNFFQLDDIDESKPALTAEERYCEELFATTTTRGTDGRFIVRMPFKENVTQLGNNLVNAERALKWQETRRRKDQVYNKLYVEYMEDYISAGHLTEVSPETADDAYYLPHHGVLKMSSTSTKLRPVFNASSKLQTGLSLNDTLCVGPTVQPDSLDILLRFREKKFVLSGDITKMYRQIWVHPSQRQFLRILWRSSFNEPIKHYQHNTVTFGTACAPNLATKCINQLGVDNETSFPAASAVLKNSFYVDDCLFSIESIEEGLQIRDHLRLILGNAGMSLCKFSSNSPALLEGLPVEFIEPRCSDSTSISKTLGIGYDTATDQFHYNIKVESNEELSTSTKTAVLSEIASMYDPVGWLGPTVLTAKLIMKKIWMCNIGWKDLLPPPIQDEWDEFRKKLHNLNYITIDRRCVIDKHNRVELHGFCDASIEAYGAVIYVRSTNADEATHTSIVSAKSRVAPKSQKSLARLELCAALLLAKLTERVLSMFSLKIDNVTLWSDATIVLHWITYNSSRLTTFVGNRVATIQDLTHSHQWKHIRGIENPADIISRGLAADELQGCTKWWNGPEFLRQPVDTWPESIITINETDPAVLTEVKRTFVVRPANDMFTYIESRFSNTRTLINVIAYAHRAAIRKIDRQPGTLTFAERLHAEATIVRVLQQHLYPEEYEVLRQFNETASPITEFKIPQVSRQSSLLSLAPFMDSIGLIRVGGRINASPGLTDTQKHPILLPSSNFALNLVREMHQKNMHLGQLALLAMLREKYYMVRAKSHIRKAIHGCLKCYRLKPTETTQFMSDLPPARVTMTPPFVNVAIDYTGFYNIRASLLRNTASIKAYVVMFKCMCSGAIHLDLVTKLTTEAFIAVLDRFVSRRGLCTTIFCDNATYFDGACTELKKIVREIQPDVQRHLAENAIEFKFTTPRAAHAGGIYESGIKSAKHHLKRVIGDTLYTYEEFVTILCKIEALLNSRPLTPISDDPFDFQPLTPGHFLIGRPLMRKPERDTLPIPTNRLTRWESIQKVQQSFWSRWYREYLTNLQTRPINFREVSTILLGALVIIKDKNVPPMKWLLGRIIELLPGRHNIVRNVRLRTQHGEITRHVKDIHFLPTEDNSAPGESVPAGTIQ